jgi:hypothetical protein
MRNPRHWLFDILRPLLRVGAALTVAVCLVAASPTQGLGATGDEATIASVDTTSHYHNGAWGYAAKGFCRATSTYTPSHRIRTQIVRSTDGWSNVISSRYRKFSHCAARQLTPTLWCTTKLVDGFTELCISTRPKAGGLSPCRHRSLDVRGVYHPHTGIIRITCVNE